MKSIFMIFFLFSSLVWASNQKDASQIREQIRQKSVQEAMEKEKRYAKEQAFYGSDEYDFESEKVNEESLPFVPELKPDDLDMDDVYD